MQHRLDPSNDELAFWNAITGRDEPGNRPCDLCDGGLVEIICSNCGGSGEGYADGTTCSVCHGRSVRFVECDSACEYCGAHAALDQDGACDLCGAFLEGVDNG